MATAASVESGEAAEEGGQASQEVAIEITEPPAAAQPTSPAKTSEEESACQQSQSQGLLPITVTSVCTFSEPSPSNSARVDTYSEPSPSQSAHSLLPVTESGLERTPPSSSDASPERSPSSSAFSVLKVGSPVRTQTETSEPEAAPQQHWQQQEEAQAPSESRGEEAAQTCSTAEDENAQNSKPPDEHSETAQDSKPCDASLEQQEQLSAMPDEEAPGEHEPCLAVQEQACLDETVPEEPGQVSSNRASLLAESLESFSAGASLSLSPAGSALPQEESTHKEPPGDNVKEPNQDDRFVPEEGFGALNSRQSAHSAPSSLHSSGSASASSGADQWGPQQKGNMVLTRRYSFQSGASSVEDREAQDLEDILQKRAEHDMLGSEEAWFRWSPPKPTSRDYRLSLRCLHQDDFDVHVTETYFSRLAIVAEVQFIESMNSNYVVHVTHDVDGKHVPRGAVGELQWHGQLIGYSTLLKEPMGSVWPVTRRLGDRQKRNRSVRVVQLFLIKRTVLLSHVQQEGNQHAVVCVPQSEGPPEDIRLRLHFCVTDTILYAPDTRLRLLRGSLMLNGEAKQRELSEEAGCDASGDEALSELVECGREATVVRLNKVGLYEVRFDGDQTQRLYTFDPQPQNHRLAVNYSFEIGAKLIALRPSTLMLLPTPGLARSATMSSSVNGRSVNSSMSGGSHMHAVGYGWSRLSERLSGAFNNSLRSTISSRASSVKSHQSKGHQERSNVNNEMWREVRVARCLEQRRFEVVDEASDEVPQWMLEPNVLCCAQLRISLSEFAAARQAYSESLLSRCCFVPDVLVANRLYKEGRELVELRLNFSKRDPGRSSSKMSVSTEGLRQFAAKALKRMVSPQAPDEDLQTWTRLLRVAEVSKNRMHGIHEVPCWLITGVASSGRTILTQRLTKKVLKMNTEIIPVLIDMADFVNVMRQMLNKNKKRGYKEAAKDPYCHRRFDFLEEYLQTTYAGTEQQEGSDILKMLQQARDLRHLVLIFDSLEHAGSMMPVMERFLAQLAFDGHRVVVTSLTSKEMGHFNMLENLFGVLEVQPLDEDQQRILAEGKLGVASAGALLGTVVQGSPLQRAAGSPIVFQMILYVAAHLGQDAIANLMERCSQVADLGCLQIDLLVYDVAVPLAFQQKGAAPGAMELLSAIALALQLMGRKSFVASDLYGLLQQVASTDMCQLWYTLQSEFEAGNYPFLRVHKSPDGKPLFSFGNESVKQYIAARFAADCPKLDLNAHLEPAIFDVDWHRFLLFYLPLRFRQGHPQHLELQSMSIKGQKVGALLGLLQCAKTFETANFADAHMQSEDAARIIAELRGSPTLTSLTLSGNHLVGAAVNTLCAFLLENGPLEHLDLRRCDLLPSCAQRLAMALEGNTTLLRIELGENFIGESGAWHFARMLHANHALRELDLRGNDVEMPSGRIFGKALEANASLQRLCLQYNYLEPEGCRRLLEGLLKNSTLQALDLQGNGMGTEEFALLGLVLVQHQSLAVLNVSGCSLGDIGTQRLAMAVTHQSCKLHTLHIRANFVTDIGARSLVDHLDGKTGISLQVLDVTMNHISEHLQKELHQSWGARDGLIVSNQFEHDRGSNEDGFILEEEPGSCSISSSESSSSVEAVAEEGAADLE